MHPSRRLSPLLLAVAMLAPPGSASAPGGGSAAARQAERVTDADGHVYRTVRIGAQTWMAENLRSTRYADGTPLQSFAYRNDSALARVHGLLYRWRAAMRDAPGSGTRPSGVQGACPSGWHVPSNAEWQQLFAQLGGEVVAGGALKEAGTRHWRRGNTGTNASGFGALPSGWFDFTGEYRGLGEGTFLRSATAESAREVHAAELGSRGAAVSLVHLHPDDAIPLRCVRDP